MYTSSTYLSPSILQHHSPHLHLHSFPTRRSSDLPGSRRLSTKSMTPSCGKSVSLPSSTKAGILAVRALTAKIPAFVELGKDRKSTRLNSSHVSISYAVFCLKKKKKNITYDKRSQT